MGEVPISDPKLFREACYVGGKWLGHAGGAVIRVENPATGELVGHVPKLGAAETANAIDAASAALPAWRALTARDRSVILRRWFDLMLANQDDLARLMTTEQGK